MTKRARQWALMAITCAFALALGGNVAFATDGDVLDESSVDDGVAIEEIAQTDGEAAEDLEVLVVEDDASIALAEPSDAQPSEEPLEEPDDGLEEGMEESDGGPEKGVVAEAADTPDVDAKAEDAEKPAEDAEEQGDKPAEAVLNEVSISAECALLVQAEDGTYSLLACDEAGNPVDEGLSVPADGKGGIGRLFVDASVTKFDGAAALALDADGQPAITTLALTAPTDIVFLGTDVPEFADEALGFLTASIALDEGWIYVPAVACAAFEQALPLWADRIISMGGEGLSLQASAGPTPGWVRLAGVNAYGTMQKVVSADLAFQDKRGGSVIVATGDGYWDALAASGLAGRLDAPVIITPTDSLASEAKEEIQRLKPERIFIMGGKAAIDGSVESELKKLCPKVARVAGKTAPDTAIKIFEAAPTWGTTAIVATCNGYWDALSIAPYSFAKGAPIFLTTSSPEGEGRILSNEALAAIKNGGFTRVVIVGGKAAVAGKVENQLSKIGVGTVLRKKGATAIDTSAEIAKWEYADEGMTIDHLTVATNNGYWDALSAAAYVGHFNSVLVLVDNSGSYQAFDAVYDYNDPSKVSYGRVLGGKAAVSSEAWDRMTSTWALKSVKLSETTVQAGTTITVTPQMLGTASGLKYNYVWVRNDSTADGEWGSTRKQTGDYTTSASGPMTFGRSGKYTITVEAIDSGNVMQKASSTAYVWKLDSVDISGQSDGTWVAKANWGVDTSKVKDVEYRFTWKRDADGTTGVIRDWGTSDKATFSEATLGYASGWYTITLEARKGGSSVGKVSKGIQVDDMSVKAQGYSSSTGYLIMVDCTNNRVGIYAGGYGNWSRIRYNVVSTGAPWTPTVKGVFTVGIKGYEFGDGYSCYYYTQFYGDYLFHTILYDPGTFNVQDGRLGENISHGCVRMALEDAKWIWDNIPYGTTVVVYE